MTANSVSNPTEFKQGIHVEWDAKTGTFRGLPKEWASALPKGTYTAETSSRALAANLRPTAPARTSRTASGASGAGGSSWRWGAFGRRSRSGDDSAAGSSADNKPIISLPYNVVHEMHVRPDSSTVTGLAGLPTAWEEKMKTSGISPQEVKANPQAALDALQFAMEGPPAKPAPLPSRRTVNLKMEGAFFFNRECNDPRRVFKDFVQLGQGASGIVYSAVDDRPGTARYGERVALKYCDLKELDDLKTEIAMQSLSTHPNVVNFLEAFRTPTHVVITIEYMDGGMLTNLCDPKKRICTEADIAYVLKCALQALAFMHRQHRIHRDIKSDNILVDYAGRVKLADFGFAKKVSGKSLDTQCGTPGYVAPEILKGAKYGTEVDMWSCGVIVYILLGGYPPFHDDNHAVLYRKIKAADYSFEPQYWEQVSDDAKDLIRKMLVVNPESRLSADQALRHPWFLVGDHELISRNLTTTLETMKKFNARRKFRGTVKGVVLANKMAKGAF
mmetsp:Transcript_3304/g.12722  ORF Transcript_3304/g.12722 Transcript_3304/m.12722 type:complete len:502 (+) Transcript_3304:339-1844(+)